MDSTSTWVISAGACYLTNVLHYLWRGRPGELYSLRTHRLQSLGDAFYAAIVVVGLLSLVGVTTSRDLSVAFLMGCIVISCLAICDRPIRAKVVERGCDG